MHYYDNVLGLIGRTPLVKLNRLTRGIKATVLAKMENLNPGFSVKDRIGVGDDGQGVGRKVALP
ncbi:MAG: pyridoxal-phosphate dependent enzyme [Acidobacteria bacterium]|nr:pyridoxal-phosphate dependent enzyme [Acidobacteriota bacterium]